MKGQIVNSFGCAKVEWACMFCMFVAWTLFSLFVVVKYFRYTYPDYADLRFLTGERRKAAKKEEVEAHFDCCCVNTAGDHHRTGRNLLCYA